MKRLTVNLATAGVMLLAYAALVIGVNTSGCTQLGIQPAKSFDERLAYAYGTHTAVLETAAAGVRSGALSKDEGATVLHLADESRTLLDSARSLETVDLSRASGQLSLASAVLTQIQTFLAQRSAKGGP